MVLIIDLFENNCHRGERARFFIGTRSEIQLKLEKFYIVLDLRKKFFQYALDTKDPFTLF